MQIAFGPIVAAYLVVQGWRAEDIGFALHAKPVKLLGAFGNVVGETTEFALSKRHEVSAFIVARCGDQAILPTAEGAVARLR